MLLTKLVERSPVKHNLVKNAASLSPINSVKNEEQFIIRFRSLAEKLHAANKVKVMLWSHYIFSSMLKLFLSTFRCDHICLFKILYCFKSHLLKI